MHVGRHGRASVSYPDALAQATNDRIAKEKGAALWHWVTADLYGNFIIKDIRVAEYNHISTQSQVTSRTLYPGAYGGPAANCSRATSTQPSLSLLIK